MRQICLGIVGEEGESVESADVVERRRSSEAAPYPRVAARLEKPKQSIGMGMVCRGPSMRVY